MTLAVLSAQSVAEVDAGDDGDVPVTSLLLVLLVTLIAAPKIWSRAVLPATSPALLDPLPHYWIDKSQ